MHTLLRKLNSEEYICKLQTLIHQLPLQHLFFLHDKKCKFVILEINNFTDFGDWKLPKIGYLKKSFSQNLAKYFRLFLNYGIMHEVIFLKSLYQPKKSSLRKFSGTIVQLYIRNLDITLKKRRVQFGLLIRYRSHYFRTLFNNSDFVAIDIRQRSE